MLKNKVFENHSEENFERIALEVFKFQAINNPIYANFIKHLSIDIQSVKNINTIPFLPIQFFKTHAVVSSKKPNQNVFSSSGTVSSLTSKHYVSDIDLYEESFKKTFKLFYGNITDYTVLALLPSYMERKGSSLIYMVNHLIKQSNKPNSGFFLNNICELSSILEQLDTKNEKILLLGVSYALLDLVEHKKFHLKNTIIMETGGMKGKRKEMVRAELHEILCNGFGVSMIHSEYGMTELLSQAYSKGNGLFKCPPWMKIIIRDTEDPLTLKPNGASGAINVIDFANLNSCAFIATDDLGRVYNDESFEILGRFDNATIRGCNLLLVE